ncbi:MAG: 2-aminoethylphosphonate--pyruvate transaminase [Oleispira sp.]|nr:2-aminoethylphosphonate--pyruvate transaminase [Oleispira sp.]MBL4881362.1 2-aminoethylphosphonate--pyruvate transaminase [Oleispira sp.]
MKNPYLLLTPGPLSTSASVKQTMLRDWCTWDDDYNLGVVQPIRQQLVDMALASSSITSNDGETAYSTVLMQGSGTFAVESAIGSAIPRDGKLLVLINGAYGKRIAEIAEYLKIAVVSLEVAEHEWIAADVLAETLAKDADITHVAMVHCETTSGILNPLERYAAIVKAAGKVLLVDAMSSFGGIDIKVADLGIDFLISSANKCIQGVPGMGFVIAKRSELLLCEGRARSLSLDLFSQWKTMEDNQGKWRFTSPTHVVRAFQQALAELNLEGGIEARAKRYVANHQTLIRGMKAQGFQCVVDADKQSPFISTFVYPDSELFDFKKLYDCLKEEGFVIYPGKVTATPCFRIGHIGEVYPEDMQRLLVALAKHRFWEQEDALENVSA